MGLIVYDGFDKYNTIADMQQRFGVLQYSNVQGGSFIGPGRAGYGKYYYSGGNWTAGLSLPKPLLTAGIAVNSNAYNPQFNFNFLDMFTGDVQASFLVKPDSGLIQLLDANGTVVQSALNSIGVNGWYFMEMQVGIGKATGSVQGTAALRINGETLASFPDIGGGINTQLSANASASGFQYAGNDRLFDDLYLADGSVGPGSYPNNSTLGDVRTATLFPISNSSVQWTPLTNTNWQEVSEAAMDSDVSYNFTATAGAQDTFNFGVLDVDVNRVLGLQLTVALRKEDAGARTVAPVIVIGGTNYVGTPVSVDVSYLYITSIWVVNPSTNASWTAAQIDALIAGYVVVT